MIYKEISIEAWLKEFQQVDKLLQFSKEGHELIFDYFYGRDDDYELDVDEICREWVEYDEEQMSQMWGHLICDDGEEEPDYSELDARDVAEELSRHMTVLVGGGIYPIFMVREF